ncbi:MAG: InlB B-repeat-containing protein, partial [Lachnospiraceae bacterium]|nr:InlB B-repeat-containing protein [Lachnospiraceae bacterium]
EAAATGASGYTSSVERVGTFANNADITVHGGWLKSAGQGGAVASYKGTINVGGDAKILEPAGGSVWLYDQAQNRYPAKTSTVIYREVVNPATEVLIGEEDGGYGLYLGSVEVTAFNREDIPIASGKASYDPLTRILKCEDAVVNTCHGVDMTQAIRVEGDLTITGKLTIKKVDDSGYGIIIDRHHTLTFKDADVTATGMKYSAIHVPSGSIEVINSKLDVSAMEGGRGDHAIYAADKLVLDKAWIKAKSNKCAIAYGYLDGREKHTIVAPANAWFDNYLVADKTSNQAVLDVEIEPAMDGEIWVGNTRVTMSNLDDVLGDGKVSYDPDTRTLRFAAGSEINSGHDVTYKQLANIYADKDLRVEGIVKLSMKAYYAIYCEGSLTLDADIEGESTGVFVVSNGTLSVEGGTINGSATEFGFYANRIEISGGDISLSAAVTRGAVMYSAKGDTLISGGKLNLTANSMKPAVCTEGDFRMTDGYLNAGSDDRAISSKTITIDEDVMRIANPEGAYVKKGSRDELINPATGFGAHEVLIYKKGTQDVTVSFDMGGHGTAITAQTIKDGGKATRPSPAPSDTDYLFVNWYADEDRTQLFDFDTEIIKDTTVYALWYEKGDYELWLGDTLVTDANCTDIFGDGKASYNPTTHTLTLKDYTGNGKYCTASELGEGDQAMIFAKQDLTIKGSASLSSNTDKVFAIGCLGGLLTIDADMDIKLTGKSSGGITAANGNIHFDGGQVNITVSGEGGVGIGFAGERFELNGASVTVYASVAGLYSTATEEGKENNVILNDGLLDLTVDKSESWLVVLLGLNFPLEIGGKLEINGGTLKAKHNNTEAPAVAIVGAVYEPDYVEFVKPAGGSFKTEGSATYVVDGEGKNANEVELGHKQCTVTFDLNGKTVYEGTAPEAQKVYAGKPALMPEYPP